jgi:predicted DNA-binding transcriptional regulator AlpA
MSLTPFVDVAKQMNVTTRTLDRWLLDERLAMPRPIKIRTRKYFDRAAIEAWKAERFRASLSAPQSAA